MIAWRKWIALGLLLVAGVGLAGVLLWRSYVASLGPLDLAEAQRGSPVVLDRHGQLLRAFTMPDGRWRLPASVKDVDPRFIKMLLAYEDHRFYEHHGVDFEALVRAALQWAWHGHVVSGGSTLTMQVARLLEPRPTRSLRAKLRQIARALQLERRLNKTSILDLYLALAPYGGNIEGIRAASLAYFGKEPKRLSVAQAALLVALPQSPETRRPDRFPAAARAARNRVLERVYHRGVITKAERDAAERAPVPKARRPFPMLAPHAAEEALRAEPHRRIHRLTIDAKWQAALQKLARDNAERLGPKISVAILVVDNKTGEIRAHVGSPNYFSKAREGAIDMTQALRSPGSALKPFIYAMAFESGIAHPETMLDDRPTRYGLYAPEDFTLHYEGTVTARRALQMSLNVPAVELLAAIGPARFLARLHDGGADIVLPNDQPPGLAVGLGGLGIRLIDIVRLFAGLARGGSVPHLIEREDQKAAAAKQPLRRITTPVAAWYVWDILRGAPPPENAPYGKLAFKTGTSYGYRDALAIGFDKADTIAVWVGRPDNSAVPGLVGRLAAAPILFDAFSRIGSTFQPIPRPPGVVIARNAQLPPPLRHLHLDLPKTSVREITPLKIAYPPQGAMIDLGLTDKDVAPSPLALKAQGGTPPFTWIVNGAPIGHPDLRRQSSWKPDGAGFARVSVIDAKGASASVVVRLE